MHKEPAVNSLAISAVHPAVHQPNQQTVLPLGSTAALLAPLDISRLKGLGAKVHKDPDPPSPRVCEFLK